MDSNDIFYKLNVINEYIWLYLIFQNAFFSNYIVQPIVTQCIYLKKNTFLMPKKRYDYRKLKAKWLMKKHIKSAKPTTRRKI